MKLSLIGFTLMAMVFFPISPAPGGRSNQASICYAFFRPAHLYDALFCMHWLAAIRTQFSVGLMRKYFLRIFRGEEVHESSNHGFTFGASGNSQYIQ